MALVLQDRVKETTTTTGTGTFTLNGTSTGFVPFSVIGNGNETYYTAVDNTTGEWEVGIGTYNVGTLTRDTVLASSNGGAKVPFVAGNKDVFVAYPAEKAVTLDTPQTLTGKTLVSADLGTPLAAILTNATGLPLSTGVTGTLPVGNGGTGATSLTGYVKASGTAAFAAVATIPGSDVSGNISGNAANVTGVVAVANGGTAVTSAPANGQLLIGNGTGYTLATLTAGTGVSITNGAGTITINAPEVGTVTAVTATAPLASSGGNTPDISLTGTVGVANGGTGAATLTGYVKASATAAFTAVAQIPNTDISGLGTMSTQNANNVAITGGAIDGTTVGATTPGSGAFTTLVAAGASITSANVGTAVVTTGSVGNLTVTGASVASANVGVALITTGTVSNLTATAASIASANVGTAVITTGSVGNLTATGASIASANVGTAVITTGTVTTLTATGASIASANVGVALVTTGTVTSLTATGASVASANVGVALITTGTVTNLTATGASIASANVGTAVVTGLTATNASIASANAGTAVVTNLTVTGASITSANVALGVFNDGTSTAPSITNNGDTNTGAYFPAADEMAITTGGTVAAGFNSNGLFFRNRIINGDMRIDQRNAGAAVTTTASFPVDRFFTNFLFDGVVSQQRSTVAPAGFTNSLGFTVTTPDASIGATQFYNFRQKIEGFNTADFGWGTANARTVTLSFWVRSSITGTYGIAITNSADSRLYPTSYTVNSADTWEQKTITVPGDTTGTWLTDNGAGVQVQFYLALGSTYQGAINAWTASAIYGPTGMVNWTGTNGATFYITGVQLETGSVATPFERRPYGTEFFLCQRYYQEVGVSAENNFIYQGNSSGNTTYYFPLPLAVPMRAAPTATVAGTWGSGNVTMPFSVNSSNNSYRVNITATAVGNFYIQNNGTGSKLTFAIEL